MRLGCLAHDAAKAASLRTRYAAAIVPNRLPRPPWTPTLGRNDTLPDCTAVGLMNAARAWVHRFAGVDDDLVVADDHIVALYAEAIGLPGASDDALAATEGADPLAVVQTAQTRGWDVGAQVPLVPDFALSGTDVRSLAHNMQCAGAVMLALTLTQTDMDAAQAGKPWTAVPDGSPIVGGHLVAACAYDGLAPTDALSIATWGTWQPASWTWVQPRLRIALIAGWRQLLPPNLALGYAALWGAAT